VPGIRASSLFLIFLFVGAAAATEWNDKEIRLLASLSLSKLNPVPASPSNRYADDAAAMALGKRLFFDARLSGNGEFSCATCHQPDMRYTDGLARSQGVGEAMRNSPTLVGTAYNRWFYWDGRRDSLWAQALIPFEAADEMGSSRVSVLRVVAEGDDYISDYESVFGMSIDINFEALPEHAGPFGNDASRSAWAAISHEDQEQINTAYVNVGKAIAAFERTLLPSESRFDRFVESFNSKDGMVGLGEQEAAGARLFLDADKTQCLQCHNGPLLTNGEFHNIGSGNFSGETLDFGRSIGLRAVLMDEFNCLGPYSDAKQYECRELLFLNTDSHLPLRGAFKVPTLRGLKLTAPYFHDGRFETLREVLEFYNTPPSADGVSPHELSPMGLTKEQLGQLEAFLLTFSD